MFRILFIDEEQDDIDSFKDYIEEKDIDGNFEVISSFPLGGLDEMLDEIFSQHVDAVITDFMLNEIKEDIKYNVPYNGVDLVREISSKREDFPCFVMTAFDDDAVGQSEDVNIVYIKGILHGTEKETKAKANFLDRVKNQILHYRTKLDNAEKRLLELLKKGESQELDAAEEEEIVLLDGLIERALDKESVVPKIVKEKKESDSLSDLLDKVDSLTKRLGRDGEN
ncbi:hypothetical protein [Reichenbachiella sp.]|uniref:hypothetical protein n=1 Tax=Reichenbachiella sp. TaxID=2184521 RepID=UPI003BB1DC0B